MFQIFYPYEYAESVFALDYEKIFRAGYRGIIFDIDMTLVPHGADSTKKVENLFKEIHNAGLKTFLLSNNDEDRVKSFAKNLDTPYIFNAEKPDTKNYLCAVEMMELQKNQVIFVGDQIFIDIYGANRSGLANILVKYVTEREEKNIGIRRNVEKIILKLYSWSNYQHRLGNIFKNGGN